MIASVIYPSVLWRCWLGGRKGIRPVKTEWWGTEVVIWLERGADLHMAQWMPLSLTVSCFSKIQIGFAFLVPAHLGSPGQRAIKWMCVHVCVCVSVIAWMYDSKVFHTWDRQQRKFYHRNCCVSMQWHRSSDTNWSQRRTMLAIRRMYKQIPRLDTGQTSLSEGRKTNN